MTSCALCGMESGINFHHEIPRAYGGEDGPQTPLCSGHHGLVHTLALGLYRTRNEQGLIIPKDVPSQSNPELFRLVRTIVISRVHYERAKRTGLAPRQGSQLHVSGDNMDKIDKIKRMLNLSQVDVVSLSIKNLYLSLVKK